jgi:LysR family transcriptional activator of nhaA
MDGLNYHHLLYFWKVAKTGSIAKASAELHLSQPTISEQIHLLETSLHRKLFDRVGRSLVLTQTGKNVYSYAEKIFALGGELTDSLRGVETQTLPTVRVGVEIGLPDSALATVLSPLLRVTPRPILEFCHDRHETLLSALTAGNLQVVLATSAGKQSTGKSHAHLLLECGTVFLAAKGKKSKRWPAAFNGQPFLLPDSKIGESLQSWFQSKKVSPKIAARSDSMSLLSSLGHRGLGVFPAPDIQQGDHRGLTVIGRTNEVRFRFYAITRERRPRDPYLVAMLAAGRRKRV